MLFLGPGQCLGKDTLLPPCWVGLDFRTMLHTRRFGAYGIGHHEPSPLTLGFFSTEWIGIAQGTRWAGLQILFLTHLQVTSHIFMGSLSMPGISMKSILFLIELLAGNSRQGQNWPSVVWRSQGRLGGVAELG